MRLSRLAELFGGWPRRLLALGCLLLAGLSAWGSTPKAHAVQQDRDVVLAARAVAAGTVLAAADVRLARWPADVTPAGAVTSTAAAVGHRVSGPMGPGEALTQQRLVSSALTAGLPPGTVAAPVLVDAATATDLVGVGDYVNLLGPPASGDESDPAQLIASAVLVLAILPQTPASTTSSAQLVVAVDHTTELRIAQYAGHQMLATLGNPP